ncbi:MAG: squalene/phytoene synthase family protein [Vulcanimicrobiota bacterium]
MSQQYTEILKETSRAFYLSLVVLPRGAREPLSLAYLLARAADTVADSPTEHPSRRAPTLRRMQSALQNPSGAHQEDLKLFRPEKAGERKLLELYPHLPALLEEVEPSLRQLIQDVVSTLIEGMLWDQELFHQGPGAAGLSAEQLERYTYLVAGCVGPFWSKICAWTDPRLAHLTAEDERAVEFGKALQWTNILRDASKDQLECRHYLPSLESAALIPAFLTGSHRALRAFESACGYPALFPRFYIRHRLAVFLPLVLGLRTLELLFLAGGPRPEQRIKVSRPEVFGWIAAGLFAGCNDTVLKSILRYLLGRAQRALQRMENDLA